MTETEFLTQSGALLSRIEEAVEASGVDADIERKGDGILELEFDNGSKIVVNSQTPMRQIWVAAKSGGFHFEFKEGAWRDTRAGDVLFDTLSRVISEQSGAPVRLGPVLRRAVFYRAAANAALKSSA
jgi:CyaY protein